MTTSSNNVASNLKRLIGYIVSPFFRWVAFFRDPQPTQIDLNIPRSQVLRAAETVEIISEIQISIIIVVIVAYYLCL